MRRVKYPYTDGGRMGSCGDFVHRVNSTSPLRYCFLAWASYRATVHSEQWPTLVLPTIETFYQRFNQEEAQGYQCCGTGIFIRFVLDVAHWLRTSRTPFGKFRKGNCTLLKMDSHKCNMHMVSWTLCQTPQYQWMLMATPLVNTLEDLYWIWQFLEGSCWLTLYLLPDRFDITLNIDDDWVTERSILSGSQSLVHFTPVGDMYKNGLEFAALVHCTPTTWDTYVLPLLGEMERWREAMKISEKLTRWHRYEESILKRACVVLCTQIV